MKHFLILLIVNCFISQIFSSPILNQPKRPTRGDLFEGDIRGVKIKNGHDARGYAQLEWQEFGLWPNGIVPYTIDDFTYSQSQLNVIYKGMKMIETQTSLNGKDCIKFVPKTNETTWIRVHSDQGCWSYFGRQKVDGEQLLSIEAPSCVYDGTVAHEFIHSLGFFHEQSRLDRDNFITVKWNNIDPIYYDQFEKYDADWATTLGFPYDYKSIMHYDAYAFSKNGKPTIVPTQPGVTLDWISSLSPIDVAEIRKYYNCQ